MTVFFSTVMRVAGAAGLLVALAFQTGPVTAADRSALKEIPYPSFIGRVLQVEAGDALQMMLVDGRLANIRLAGLQAPADGEFHAAQSRQWLHRQLAGQIVAIDCDPRTVDGPQFSCVVYPDDRNINYLALRLGMARTLQSDLQRVELSGLLDAERYTAAESIANSAKVGMWAVSTVSAISP